ncbi:MAG: hypothetical protein OZ948_06595 [Deltaproteobacteria bacterium]|nr:hypothetical protein [Deltaproteobacteria bacterium]
MPGDTRRRVLLLCTEPLLGDGLGAILGGLEDIELVGPLALDERAVRRAGRLQPDLVLLAEDGGGASAGTHFVARLLAHCPDVPVIRVGLREDTIHLLTSRTVPASRTELIEAIRRLPLRSDPGARPAARAPETKR